ncbi:MAG TPA: hypothetical protein VNP89_00405 [Gaiellaceae bacterium]|nr:hypothetical protein [Gaiellaceae bacterium]
MLRLPVIAASLAALALPLDAHAGNVIAFDRATAQPNERVKITSALSRPVRLYLVRQDVARAVTSRTDRRLSFVGALGANRSLTFNVPPLDAGTYSLVVWCRRCEAARFRTGAARLQIRSTAGCPVTRPNGSRPQGQLPSPNWHGNGLLWTSLSAEGFYAVPRERVEADGSIFNKLPWETVSLRDEPTVSGVRLDATAPPLKVLGLNGSSPSYRSPVLFPTPGCWRVTARIGDVSLTYVVSVVIRD